MTKSFCLILLFSGMVFASGTITPGSKAGLKCAMTSVEGNITFLDVEQKTFTVGERKFRWLTTRHSVFLAPQRMN
jgi:hypothetical protein